MGIVSKGGRLARTKGYLRNIWEKNWPEIHAAVTGGLPRFIAASNPDELGSTVPAFCFHVVQASTFQADLEFLMDNDYTTVHADALLDHLKGRRTVPERAVVLTFDDGPRNLYEVAFPLLERYGMKAVAFIAPRFHGEEFDLVSDQSNASLYPLSWGQIQEMHASGVIDFQSHTYEHRYIPRWPEPADLEGSDSRLVQGLRGEEISVAADMLLAREILEYYLGKRVQHLAFPRFKGTPEAVQIGIECGYEAFWWGVLPHHAGNRPGQSLSHIVRLKCEFLRRLPGKNRLPLGSIMGARYGSSARRLWSHFQREVSC